MSVSSYHKRKSLESFSPTTHYSLGAFYNIPWEGRRFFFVTEVEVDVEVAMLFFIYIYIHVVRVRVLVFVFVFVAG